MLFPLTRNSSPGLQAESCPSPISQAQTSAPAGDAPLMPDFSPMRNRGKNRLGRSPLRTSLGYEAGPAMVLRPGRKPMPYQERTTLCFSPFLLGECTFLQISALSGPPGPRRPGIGPTPPRLEALAMEGRSASGVGYPRDVMCHLCDPTGTRADYGPTAQNNIKPLGFQKGRAPFVAFRPFWPLKMDPQRGARPLGWQARTREKTIVCFPYL